jgi:hypothetical protein
MINKWVVDEQTGWITRDDNITPGKDNKRMNAQAVKYIYQRKSNKHNWNIVGVVSSDNKVDFVRIVYNLNKPGYSNCQVGYQTINNPTGCHNDYDNLKANAKLRIVSPFSYETALKAIDFANNGIISIIPTVVKTLTELGFLDGDN